MLWAAPAPWMVLKSFFVQLGESDADFDADFLKHTFPKLNWPAFLQAANAVGQPSTKLLSSSLQYHLSCSYIKPELQNHFVRTCPSFCYDKFEVSISIPNTWRDLRLKAWMKNGIIM